MHLLLSDYSPFSVTSQSSPAVCISRSSAHMSWYQLELSISKLSCPSGVAAMDDDSLVQALDDCGVTTIEGVDTGVVDWMTDEGTETTAADSWSDPCSDI